MTTMLNVYDRQTRKKTAVLQNAYDVTETHELNQIYSLKFTLPSTDEKNKFCLPRHFVRWGDDGELYRIKAPSVNEGNVGTITYSCEHVITTLCDTVMFGSFQYGGASVKTRATINWLLSKQKQQDWVLDVCEFDRKFEYLWEQENILNALYSIPKEFAQPYKWTFDTTVYPWKLSLRTIDESVKPEYYLRARSNILASGSSADYANICTRIYPLGYGEGVNQLNIKDVNNGVAYIQSPQSIIDQYGIVEKVLVDRRFENAESLKAYAQTMLDKYQTPSMSRSFDVTDLYPLTGQSWDDAEVGKICRMTEDGTTAYVTKTQRTHDKAGDLQIDLSTKATDITSSVAELADRIRIESVYAQGATQLYQHSKDANATPQKGMVMSLYFPAEMRQINKVLLRLKLNKFRSYSQTTDAGGQSTRTSSEGGRSTQTSSAGGASTQTSSAGGESTQTSSSGGKSTQTSSAGGGTGNTSASTGSSVISGRVTTTEIWEYSDFDYVYTGVKRGSEQETGDSIRYSDEDGEGYTDTPEPYYGGEGHYHEFYRPYRHYHKFTPNIPSLAIDKRQLAHTHDVDITEQQSFGSHSHSFSIGTHTHTVSIPAHTHTVSIPAHTHTVSIPAHTHSVNIPDHTHTVDIPAHTHRISAGIFESGNATAFDIYVGNTKKVTVNSTSYDGDITTWLLNNQNLVPRDTWIDVTIVPNDLAYVVSSVFIQGFVQSRGGGNY